MVNVYFFGEITDKYILGNKGAQLSEMTKIGLPVPPGFTISTKVCIDVIKNKKYPEGLKEEVEANLKRLEDKTGKKFGDPDNLA